MRVILTVLVLCLALAAEAKGKWGGGIELDNTYVVGKVTKVESLCPAGAVCITDGTVLTLKYKLRSGCDQLTDFSWQLSPNGKRVEVTAIQTGPADLSAVLCPMIERVYVKTISLPMVFRPLTVSFVTTKDVQLP